MDTNRFKRNVEAFITTCIHVPKVRYDRRRQKEWYRVVTQFRHIERWRTLLLIKYIIHIKCLEKNEWMYEKQVVKVKARLFSLHAQIKRADVYDQHNIEVKLTPSKD